MQRAPLAQDFGEGPCVDDLIWRDPRQRFAGDVADGVAACLDAVHLHTRQQFHDISCLGKWDPVELNVGAGGEVAVAVLKQWRLQCQARLRSLQFVLLGLGVGEQLRVRAVVFARYAGEHVKLLAADLNVGNGNPGHGRIALHVPAILQPQRQELLISQLTSLPALQLVTKLLGAQGNELLVKLGVLVHQLIRWDTWKPRREFSTADCTYPLCNNKPILCC